MCGIIGYIGKHIASEILIDGLKRLEYRGYDSAGLITSYENTFFRVREPGRVENLRKKMSQSIIKGHIGLAHTRWATHGGVTENNAHPHTSSDGRFAIVHNGVIENYLTIKKFLENEGYTFTSETDTEALVNLISYHYNKESLLSGKERFFKSVSSSLAQVEGTYGIAVISLDHPGEIIGARKSSPLLIGIGEDEFLLASDISAVAMRTKNVVYLKDGEIAHIYNNDFSIATFDDQSVNAVIETVEWQEEDAELGDFNHFMEKEIFEQPAALLNAMRGRFSNDHSTAHFGGLNISPKELRHVDRILFCACGSAWHACLVAEYLIERYARIPVEVEYASEFRYRNAPLDKNTLVFVISQSGETIDTLAALNESIRKGHRTLAITNVVGSTIARESDGGIYQRAGHEIGVASTKAFTSQLLICAMLALYLGRLRDMSFEDGVKFVEALKKVPEQVAIILNQSDSIREIAIKYAHSKDFLFLGRQLMFPIALEGALKLKEISYIHAEGYPAAELKHGPIALISPECPSVFLAPQSQIFQKSLSNIQEIKARGGPLIGIASENSNFPINLVDHLITIPEAHEAVQPILACIPVQLLAYYIAVERGCDIDKPRNLAKSVTVE
ncbi:MAG: glutamine--fructose-6-phosphate transaminase (isomerizing) [Verrucomicrobia bacterium]|nr:MAG: glutamine--fructose-6-phosphate transaminase (isomerizing) [Verrucomicrobiota bacterium]